MRKIIFISFLFIVSYCAFGQYAKKPSFYIDLGLDHGNYAGASFTLNFITKNNLVFSGFYAFYQRYPNWLDKSSINALTPYIVPKEKNHNIGVSFGKGFYLNDIETIRFSVNGGVGFTKLYDPIYKENISIDNAEFSESFSPALYLNPRLEFPFSRYFGLGVGCRMTATKDRYYFGISTSLLVGSLREKKINN
ncbi:hypothetical protein [Marinigracilibium pacificum]|uniref:Outer membrane protein beta-barrel domain-containing protein n=1 Tax=Marinigracilibium pacificum TaxID=2729599 RepID=A0A848J3M7_9BACT|nr:hypothetical protein [Marinigracilibium pacificum]NMM50331.1 hypothetical protein [Marinigracilibium pacificum]